MSSLILHATTVANKNPTIELIKKNNINVDEKSEQKDGMLELVT